MPKQGNGHRTKGINAEDFGCDFRDLASTWLLIFIDLDDLALIWIVIFVISLIWRRFGW